ncbi:hypothetical protein JAAARDRAFT_51342 [Jaapia argillacea MUCL 33604]|uniref:Uncharacterized protein n=1 Tax=Jaapia argillacea MUCL 33604 TaxID=933084 RepID=A0A067P697_9AGAM|nr:hypothetical protein JAAARDRAFT_51342 [Jaapia argillacea MUCL 33604]
MATALQRVIAAHHAVLQSLKSVGDGFNELSNALLVFSWEEEQDDRLSQHIFSFATILGALSFSFDVLSTELEVIPHYFESLNATQRSLHNLRARKDHLLSTRTSQSPLDQDLRALNAKIIAEEHLVPDTKRSVIKHSMKTLFTGILKCLKEQTFLGEDGIKTLDAFKESRRAPTPPVEHQHQHPPIHRSPSPKPPTPAFRSSTPGHRTTPGYHPTPATTPTLNDLQGSTGSTKSGKSRFRPHTPTVRWGTVATRIFGKRREKPLVVGDENLPGETSDGPPDPDPVHQESESPLQHEGSHPPESSLQLGAASVHETVVTGVTVLEPEEP